MITQKNSAKAIILDRQNVLLLKKVYEDGQIIYTLPGGTQEPGEVLSDTVIREVYEEAAAHVEVLDIACIYEHMHASRTTENSIKHKLEFAFLCRIIEPYEPQNGLYPDPHQVAVEWVNIDALNELTLNPLALADLIPDLSLSATTVYLGKVS